MIVVAAGAQAQDQDGDWDGAAGWHGGSPVVWSCLSLGSA